MQVQAITRDIRISPRKVRLVADAVRGVGSVDEAIATLSLLDKRGATAIAKTINSAVANAVTNAKLEKANLAIHAIEVTEGQALKRYHPSTRGRIHPYKRRSSHIRVILQEKTVAPAVSSDVKAAGKEKSADAKAMADKGGKK